jgi:hypothetical protein
MATDCLWPTLSAQELLRSLFHLPFMPHFLILSNEELHLNYNMLHSQKYTFMALKSNTCVTRTVFTAAFIDLLHCIKFFRGGMH